MFFRQRMRRRSTITWVILTGISISSDGFTHQRNLYNLCLGYARAKVSINKSSTKLMANYSNKDHKINFKICSTMHNQNNEKI